MGAYRFLGEQVDDTLGIVETASSTFIPPNTENRKWVEYLAWKAAPNTPDAGYVPSLAEERTVQKRFLDRAAEDEVAKSLYIGSSGGGGPGVAFIQSKLIQEAIEVEGDGTPTAGRYPMLNEQIPNEGASIAAVGTAIRTWIDSKKVRLGDIENLRRKAHKDIDSAGTLSAIRAILPAITWPA